MSGDRSGLAIDGMSRDVREALMPLLAHGGQLDDGRVEARFDRTDAGAVHNVVAGSFAMSEVARLLGHRARLGLRGRVIDAMQQAQTDAERDALVAGCQATVQRGDAEAIAARWASDLRGRPRMRALDLVGQRPLRTELAVGIDDDREEDQAVRGAALDAALQQQAPEALVRLVNAIRAGEAWRVVEAAANCGRPFTDDEASAMVEAISTAPLSAPTLAALLARLAPERAARDAETLANAMRRTPAAPDSAEARAAELLAATDLPPLARGGAEFTARIGTGRHGALALAGRDSDEGRLALSPTTPLSERADEMPSAGCIHPPRVQTVHGVRRSPVTGHRALLLYKHMCARRHRRDT